MHMEHTFMKLVNRFTKVHIIRMHNYALNVKLNIVTVTYLYN